MLIGAAGVSALLGELIDGVAIIAIVVLNAVIGFFQEYRAERAALAPLTAPRAKIVRDGTATVIPALYAMWKWRWEVKPALVRANAEGKG